MRPTREDLAVGRAIDICGYEYLVAEFRATKHGFDLAIGWELDQGRGAPKVILTPALVGYVASTLRLRDVDLPIGRTAIKALRERLEVPQDRWATWWAERAEDLRTLTLEQFAMRHGCCVAAASTHRSRLRDRATG